MMMQKTLTLTDSHQMGGEAGMEDAAYCVTTLAAHQLTPATLRLQLLVMMLYLIYLE